ncbi:hypothetical protein G6F31_018160 [Rhizopus arrhizus]|nr:hypothetical protein G6F31_018160 [Rhizopus arrhizus]
MPQLVGVDEIALRLAHDADVGHDAGPDVVGAFLDIRGMVFEHHDARRIDEPQRTAKTRMQHVRGHTGVVLVDETPIRPEEHPRALLRVAGGNRRFQQMAPDDFLEKRARRIPFCCRGWPLVTRPRLPHVLQVRLPERQQAARPHDGG